MEAPAPPPTGKLASGTERNRAVVILVLDPNPDLESRFFFLHSSI